MKNRKRLVILSIILPVVLIVGAIAGLKLFGPIRLSYQSTPGNSDSAQVFVSYHKDPPTRALPPTALPSQFKDKATRVCYRMAGENKSLLYQLPCLCACDKMEGHQSLLDCFTSKHGATCEVCKREVAYAVRENNRGVSIEQIRQGIMHGMWQEVNLENFALLDGVSETNQKSQQQHKRAR